MCVSLVALILPPLLAISTSALVVPKQPPAAANCSFVTDIFNLRNITFEIPDEPVNGSGLCGEQVSCCSPEMEATLQTTVAHDLHSLLYHSFHSIHGMLATTEQALAEDVQRVSSASENMTLAIFAEVYKGMWNEVRTPISDLFTSLTTYLKKGRSVPTELPPVVPTEDNIELKAYVLDFFKKLFPFVYHQTVHSLESNVSTATDEYAGCLHKSFEGIRPFGHYPEELADRVAKSFETTRVLLQAMTLGIEVLNVSDHVMSAMPENTDSCREALFRLYYCPKCLGLPLAVKPCNGYCLNVMRGCLTQHRTTELDLPWSNFLLEVERLAKEIGNKPGNIPSIDNVLMGFSSTVSDAIMYAAMMGPDLEKKVKVACGAPKLQPRTTPEPPSEEMPVPRATGESPVTKQLRLFVQNLETTKARGFFANLAEALCSDDSFAETRDTADCWNGHRVGEYTKVLVRPGLDAQKYNPELNWTVVAEDPSIRHLNDKLRHMRQVVLSHLLHDKPVPMPYSQISIGSGSGRKGYNGFSGSPDDLDDMDDNAYDEGSGSGDFSQIHDTGNHGETRINTIDNNYLDKTQKDKAGGSGVTIQASLITIVLLLSSSLLLL